MTTVCPQCYKDDQIRKVTSIVTDGSSTVNYTDALGTLGGTGSASYRTELAKRLMTPSEKDWKHLKEKWSRQPKDNWVLQDYLKSHPAPSA